MRSSVYSIGAYGRGYAQPPGAPVLTASPTAAAVPFTLHLAWTPVGQADYIVEFTLDGGAPSELPVSALYVDAPISGGGAGTYVFRVRGAAADSPWSNSVTVVAS